MERSTSQKLIAEFIGTFALVFIPLGAITASPTTAGGGIVAIALASGLVVAVMVSAVGHISGAHFNPAVTIGVWIAQRIRASLALAYIAAQCAGGIAAALLLRVAIPKTLIDQGGAGGVPLVGSGISNGQAVLIEAILTFFLVWVIFGTAIDSEGAFSRIAGLAIGFIIVADTLVAAPFTGAAMNPARSLGPALAFGRWRGWWVYWIGPIAGGIVASALYDGLLVKVHGVRTKDQTPPEDPPDQIEAE